MYVDDAERVDLHQHRLAAATVQWVRHGHSQHQSCNARPGPKIEPRVTDIDVTRRGCDRCSPCELENVEVAMTVDLQQHVVRLDGRVVDDDGAVPRSPDEMPARLQLRPPTRVGSRRHVDPHGAMRGGLRSRRKAASRGVVPSDLRRRPRFSVARMTRLGSRLDREWSQLRSRPALLRHAAGWAIVEGPLHDLDQILAAVGYQVAWTARNEAAMRELVLRAADDELAARIAIQRILPGLLAIVRRRGAADEDGLDELIGAAWIGVRTFNPARRSRCVAAALIADADYRAFRSRWRRRCAGERPIGLTPELPYDEPADTPAQVLADLLARAEAAGIPDDDLALIRRAAEDDASTEQLARELQVTARTVRNRRARVTDRLRQLAAAA